MSRDVGLYLEDIERACDKIERFTSGMALESFVADERTYDAVLRNVEVIGEAAKRVPDPVRAEMPEVPWIAISGSRDFVAHVYFALDNAIVGNAVTNEVPKLHGVVESFLTRTGANDAGA
ncbi:MAG: hypothetical protein JWN04_3039 [Myxococcaceae bacterium]|nr:hypothetical protein [Myxococcaceae bacterium]